MTSGTIERSLPDQSRQSGYDLLPEELQDFAYTFKIDPERYQELPLPLVVAGLVTGHTLLAESITRRFNDAELKSLPIDEGLKRARLQVRAESPDYIEAANKTNELLQEFNISDNPKAQEQYKKMLQDLSKNANRLISVKSQSYDLHSRRGDTENVEKLASFFAVFDIPVAAPTHTLLDGRKAPEIQLTRDADKAARMKALIASTAVAATIAVASAGPAAAADKPSSPSSQSQPASANEVLVNPLDAVANSADDNGDYSIKSTYKGDPGFARIVPGTTKDPGFAITLPNATQDPGFARTLTPEAQPSVSTSTDGSTNDAGQATSETQPKTDSSSVTSPDQSGDGVQTPDVTVVVDPSQTQHEQTKTTSVDVLGGTTDSSTNPAVPVAPNTAPLDVAQSLQEAKHLQNNLQPAFKSGFEKIPKAVAAGSLNALTHGGDIYTPVDPTHPKKTLKLVMSETDKTRISALYDQMMLVMANPDNELLLSSIEAQYANVDATMAPAVSDAIKKVTGEQFSTTQDYTDRQKRLILLISYDINNITTASAEAQTKAAQAVHDAAVKRAAQKALQATLNGNIDPKRFANYELTADQLKVVDQVAASKHWKDWQKQEFHDVLVRAVQIADIYHISPFDVVPQAVLESGNFDSSLTRNAHNMFGVKGKGNDGSVYVPTSEWKNGKYVHIMANFAAYKTNPDSLQDYASHLLQKSWFADARWFYLNPTLYMAGLENDIDRHGNELHHRRMAYATSPDYEQKIAELRKELRLDELIPAEFNISSNVPYDMLNKHLPEQTKQLVGPHPGLKVYYSQRDQRWASKEFNYSTIEASGCGDTSITMMLNNVHGMRWTPDVTAKYSDGFRHEFQTGFVGEVFAKHLKADYGIESTLLHNNIDKVMAALRNGETVVIGGKGNRPYTGAGHIIYAYGLTKDGRIKVADPWRGFNMYYSEGKLAKGMRYAVAFPGQS